MPVRMAALPQMVPEAIALADSSRIPHQSTILPPRHLEIIFRFDRRGPEPLRCGEERLKKRGVHMQIALAFR